MDFSFADPDSLIFHAKMVNGLVSFFFACLAVGIYFNSKTDKRSIGWQLPVFVTVTLFCISMAFMNSPNASGFTDISLSESEIKLHYVWPTNEDILLASDDVNQVLVGYTGKTARQCHVTLMTIEKERYRSADRTNNGDICKTLAAEISQHLQKANQAD